MEILEEKSDLKDSDQPIGPVKDGSIEFRDVSFGYQGKNGQLCLEHINLAIPAGSTVGIIGGTGSAKTTLVQLIPRLYDATCGSVVCRRGRRAAIRTSYLAERGIHGAAEKRAFFRHH